MMTVCMQPLSPAAPYHADCTQAVVHTTRAHIWPMYWAYTKDCYCGRCMRAVAKARLLLVSVVATVLGCLGRTQRSINTQRFTYINYSPLRMSTAAPSRYSLLAGRAALPGFYR